VTGRNRRHRNEFTARCAHGTRAATRLPLGVPSTTHFTGVPL